MPNVSSAPSTATDAACRTAERKASSSCDHVIRRHDQQQRRCVVHRQRVDRRKRDSRRRIPSLWLEDQVCAARRALRSAGLRGSGGHRCRPRARVPTGHPDRRAAARCAAAHGLITVKRQKLLRALGARGRPQPAARAAGEYDGLNDCHGAVLASRRVVRSGRLCGGSGGDRPPAANSIVLNTHAFQESGVIQVATVENDRIGQRFANPARNPGCGIPATR